jgi:uncharacterized protein YjbI with pentapeptide repeats
MHVQILQHQLHHGRQRRGWPGALTFVALALLATSLLGGPWISAAIAVESGAGMGGVQDLALAQERVDYTLTNQDGKDFSGQQLANSSFAGVTARDADFSNADLHGAILTQASFLRSDFSGADLSDVLMDRADFTGTDLSGALLRGVIAAGSSFSDAVIDDADFSDALLDRSDQRVLCRRARGTNPTTGVSTRLSLDCP